MNETWTGVGGEQRNGEKSKRRKPKNREERKRERKRKGKRICDLVRFMGFYFLGELFPLDQRQQISGLFVYSINQ